MGERRFVFQESGQCYNCHECGRVIVPNDRRYFDEASGHIVRHVSCHEASEQRERPRYPRDLDPSQLEPHFSRHMNAMTAERLDGKAGIAEQLAWRDQQIEDLRAQLANARAVQSELAQVYREEHERIAPLLAAADWAK